MADASRRLSFRMQNLKVLHPIVGKQPVFDDQLRTFAPSGIVACMTATDHEWSLCNSGPDTLLVWLEPWCDEFEVPVRSTITLKSSGDAEQYGLGEIEWGPDNLVVWATGPTMTVFIDDVLQRSGSATIPIPDGLTKGMLNVVFADQPAARLGGRPSHAVGPTSWWQRVKGMLDG